MSRCPEPAASLFRRAFLTRSTLGIGSAALASLVQDDTPLAAAANRSSTKQAGHWSGVIAPRHHAPRAKRVIFLCMAGGPSHLETFDPKPDLAALHGQPMPRSVTAEQPIAQLQGQALRCLAPQFRFLRSGVSGQLISEVLPKTRTIADEICIVRSMVTEAINHDPAHTYMNTGSTISGRPSMGSWVTYGLGSESRDLPGFVVLTSRGGRNPQPLSSRQWHSGFLPGRFQGVPFQTFGDPVHYLGNPAGVNRDRQRDVVDAIQALNALGGSRQGDSEAITRINQYEMAFRMQTSVPQLRDFSDESKATLDLYGAQEPDGSFAANCLMARRLAERGVRFIQLYHRGWDHHNDLVRFMKVCAGHCDQASAALIADLKQRGMLDDTLVVWGGEFGRTPMAQTNKGGPGRDHHMRAFSVWLAGGGIRGGQTYGATDDLGYHSVDQVVHVNDLHATMLHLLGVNHQQLTYRFQGRDFRLTDVGGRVVKGLLV